ncbi:homocysteine S-methyltransferase family protein [Conexibacter arvalis]|uniref:Homocysteine S-methyltransferase n=1 Tax=Conexibacter arvalis TaxID=912552 RepID=A0A840I9P0_9ACTN|nr:homocysteine S-methyltransferase family protein [Conexibacter arvalis]MBB4661629.1 homocysteine S-methyltransferase [Conexibacter arvalis]
MLRELVDARVPILAGTEIESALASRCGDKLDPRLDGAGLLGAEPGREALRALYAEHVDVAWLHGLPAVVGTPTFRASRRHVERARCGGEAVRRLNAEAVALVDEVRAAGEHEPVFVAGVVGPHGDPYQPGDALAYRAGAEYHAEQVAALVDAGVDLLVARTFPSIEEAHGAAIAMSTAGLPYAVDFVLDDRGRLLDRTYLHAAITRIDECVVPEPAYYSASCLHPAVARTALNNLFVSSSSAAARLREVKANAADAPEAFGAAMHRLGRDFEIPILGGCRGASAQHLTALARRLEARAA